MTEPGGSPIGTATGARALPPASRATPRQGAVQGKALETLTQGLLVLVLPRLLGPAEFGRLTLGIAVVTLGTVAISLGAPSAFARFLPAEAPARRAAVARAMTLRLARLRAVQLLGAGTLGIVAVLVAPSRLHPVDAALIFLALAIDVVALLGAQVSLGTGRTRLWSFRLAARNVALLLAVPVLLRVAGPETVLVGLVVSSLVGFACAGWPGLRLVSRADGGAGVPAGAASYGTIAGLSLLVGQLVYRGPVLAASALAHSAVETGYAAFAGSIAMAIRLVIRELLTVSLPEMVEIWQRDPRRADAALRRVGWRVVAVLIPVALVGMLLLERAVPLVAGPAFAPAAAACVPLLVMLPLLPLPALGWQGAALRLQPGRAVWLEMAGAAAFFASAAVLVPLAGAAGASAALGLAVLVSGVVGAWLVPGSVAPGLLLAALGGAGAVVALASAIGAMG